MNAPFRPDAAQVVLADPRDSNVVRRIAGYLADRPDATAFHRPEWLVAAARGTGNPPVVLILERHGTVAAMLPLMEVHSPVFGRVLVSSGFGVGGGLLADNRADSEVLFTAVEELAMRRSCASVELRGGVLPQDRFGWQTRTTSHCGFERPLAPDDEAELLAIPRKQRAEVRKGLGDHLTVTVGTADADRDAHYAVYAQSVRNLGTPVFPKRLFSEVLDAFEADADILTVWHHGKAVASVLSLYHRGAVMPYWGGGTYAARHLRANDRMYYELMLHARRRGCDRFDFGRSKTGSGAYDFKRNWGFQPEPLGYAMWTAPGAAARDADPTSAAHSAKIALWKRLPLPVANLIGPLIARGLG